MYERIKLTQGDITTMKVDAIVNAANESLLGGGGVDGAIHRRAGPKLLAECRTLQGCKTGDAKITAGHNLPARHVIHSVGPIYNDGKHGEPELLADCYRRSLEVAVANNVHTIAFPAISCGAFGYPLEDACRIAIREVRKFIAANPSIQEVFFVCFDHIVFDAYQRILQE